MQTTSSCTTLCTTHLGACWDLSLHLETERGDGVGLKETLIVLHGNCLRRSHHHFLGQYRINSLRPRWKVWWHHCELWGHLGKKAYQNLGAQHPQLHQGFPSTFQFTGCHSFLIRALTLMVDTLQNKEFKLLAIQPITDGILHLIFTIFSLATTGGKGLLQDAGCSLWVIYVTLALGIGIPELIFIFLPFAQ